MSRAPDVVVVGAGVVGAACASSWPARAPASSCSSRPFVASGSSGACEGNVLAWDKELERELPLALRSADAVARARRRARPTTSSTTARAASSSPRPRPSCVASRRARARARRLGVARRGAGRRRAARARSRYAAHDLPGGVLYPGDAQLEPRLATAALVRAAVRRGRASCRPTSRSKRIVRERLTGARPASRRARGRIAAGAVVVAAGVWTPHAAGDRCGLPVPVTPRKGQIVVLERSPVALPPQAQRGRLRRRRRGRRRRAADRDGGRVDAVSGTALLGSSRQHVGFDREVDSASPARSPAAPRASSRSCTTPARCASTPACAR